MRINPAPTLLACLLALWAASPPAVSAQQLIPFTWNEDARWLRAEFAEQHANAFHARTRAEYDAAFDRLTEWIPRLDPTGDHAVVVAFARTVNAVGDGHSGIRLFADTAIAFRALPVRLGAYPGGLFVEAAAPEHADLVGARVRALGNVPAAAALGMVAPLIARDNDMDVLRFGPALLVMPEVLHALGAVSNPEAVDVELESDGERWTVRLSPGPIPFLLEGHSLLDVRGARAGWPDALGMNAPEGSPVSLLFRDPEADFWAEWLDEERAMYAQVNRIGDSPEQTFEEFSERLVARADSLGAERLLLDLRWNRGGDNYLIRPLVRSIVQSRFDEEGRLFVLIGRYTFSAAQSLVNELSRLSSPVYVGEPTAAAPNGYGDNRKLVLPNSHITVRASYLWWQQRDPRDERRCTAPHVHAPMTFEDYLQGADPGLEAALAWAGEGDAGDGGTGADDPALDAEDPAAAYQALLCRDGPPRLGRMF
ncbi:MAG: hypothetical protein ABFS34_08115 [Gemmatimonadota bacterium]